MISEQKGQFLHGILLIVFMALSAFFIASFDFVKSLSISPLIVGIIVGMLYANTLGRFMPAAWAPGIKFCSKRILRIGIIFYGFRLTFQQVFDIGLPAIELDAIIITGTMIIGLIAGRILRLDTDTTLMTSTGSAVCGAAAVLGAEPVVKCESHKTAIAVSTVVIFGVLAMFLYPILYRAGIFDLTNNQWGIYTGGTLHEVANVVGAGNAMDPSGELHIADDATITKMIRVIMLAPMLIIMSIILSISRRKSNTAAQGKTKITIPWFAFGFLLMIGINSLLITWLPESVMTPTNNVIKECDTFLLTMAMTALGVDTSFDKFRQAGFKPFLLALILWIWLIFGGLGLTKLLVN